MKSTLDKIIMLSEHLALFCIVGFDAVVVGFFYGWLRSVRGAKHDRLIKMSVVVIGCLVNLSGMFCSGDIVKTLTVIGGAPLVLLLLTSDSKAPETKDV